MDSRADLNSADKRKPDATIVEAWAEACIECDECEPKCPQNIPIREQLKGTATALGEN
jgi:predicted aldo/keto reductase-like oxidoreductase